MRFRRMLEPKIEVTVWDQGIFEPSGFILEDLTEKMQNFDFAAFIFSGDDVIKIRDKEKHITRDNVIFELGLFIGKLGRKNNFIVVPEGSDLRIPSDLLGINYITFNPNRQDGNLNAALGPVKNKIQRSIEKLYQEKAENSDSKQSSIIASEGELYEEYRLILQSAVKNLYIITNQRDWIFPLIISLTAARKRGLNIFIAYYYSTQKEKESIRLKLLDEIGCNVVFKSMNEKPSFRGIISNPLSKGYSKLVILPDTDVNESNVAKKYMGASDNVIVDLAFNTVQDIFSETTNKYLPTIEKVNPDELNKKMKNVPFYRNCTFSLETVEIKDIIPLTKYVREFKLNQISTLVDFYKEINLPLFEPCAIVTKSGSKQLLVPPVLELYDGKLYVAEGHSRSLYCLQNNINSFTALIVKGCSAPLASNPNKWENVKIAYTQAKTHAVYEGRRIELARRIETYTHWIND